MVLVEVWKQNKYNIFDIIFKNKTKVFKKMKLKRYERRFDENNILNDLNPTGGIFVDYKPEIRAKAKLGKNITTLDKTMGGSPTDTIIVYRGTSNKKIVPGDFITTNKQLAKDYGGGNVISLKVKKGDILDDITEPEGEEYIYRPNAYKELQK